MICDCAKSFEVVLGRPDDRKKAKSICNRGRHPTFVGPNTWIKNSVNGGMFLFYYRRQPVAVALLNPSRSILLVLNVVPEHRSHGLGAAVIKYLKPNFCRVIESATMWFERQGYVKVGEKKQGRRFKTWVMVRSDLLSLQSNIQSVFQDRLAETINPSAPDNKLGGRKKRDQKISNKAGRSQRGRPLRTQSERLAAT